LEKIILDEYMLLVNVLLFLSVSVILVVYLKRTWSVNKEYIRAKNVIEEVVLSFNRELQNLKQKIGEIDIKFQNIQSPEVNQIRSELGELASKIENLLSFYSVLEKKFEDMKVNIDELSKTINQQEKDFKLPKKLTFPIRQVIPLKRERALASLTPTELKVLEILSTEGDKTVREIKDRLGLTREHTGRLMKNLYDKGYVERRTNKIPYTYRIKKEMGNILSNKNQ